MSMVSGGVGNFLEKGLQNVDSLSSKLDTKMKDITANGKEMKQEDLIMLQYEMGQYQASMTALNNIMQSIQGQVKELAKSIH